jgi:hypothetical protein
MRVLALTALCLVACTRRDPVGAQRVEQITVGSAHACARRADGRVVCWGGNRDGELGVEGHAVGPVLVEFIVKARDIAAGPSTTCAVVEQGEVECWGLVWTKSYQRARQRIPGVRGAARVFLAGFRACAIGDDGAATCWGPGDEGRPGLGGWPPAPDERYRGATAGGGADEVLCARLPDRIRCSTGSADRLDFAGAEAAVVRTPDRAICLLREGVVTCTALAPDGKLIGAPDATRAGFGSLVAFGRFLCGALGDGSVGCFDSSLPERDRRVEAQQGLASPIQIAAGPDLLCGLTAEHVPLCTDRPGRPPAVVADPAAVRQSKR